jgi:adenosylcobinamide amidohydrolase
MRNAIFIVYLFAIGFAGTQNTKAQLAKTPVTETSSVVRRMVDVYVQSIVDARGVHQDLRAYAIATAGCGNMATVGETGAYVEGEPQPIPPGTINLIVAVNYGFTHEAMLEAISIATEAKVRAMYEFGLTSRATGQPATGTGTDCVAVASGHDRRYLYCGKHTKWGKLIGRACLESIRGAVRAAISFEQGESGRAPDARLAKKGISTKRNDSFGRPL